MNQFWDSVRWMSVMFSLPPPFFIGFYLLGGEKSISGARPAAQGQMAAYVMITESQR